MVSGKVVQRILEEANAFWMYGGSPRKEAPHALLTSGKHSDGYVDVGGVIKKRDDIRELFAESMLEMLPSPWEKLFDRVVGADTSSTKLAADIARIANVDPARTIDHIRMIKDKEHQLQIWDPENKPLEEGEYILQTEELVTTGISPARVQDGIGKANPGIKLLHFVPFLLTIVERSDPDNRVTHVNESEVLSLLQLSIRNYDPGPERCRYCAAGSEAIKPKEGDNWAKLIYV